MAVLKNILIQGLLAFTAVAVPLASEESSVEVRSVEAFNNEPVLEARKNANKCEAHIYLDSSNGLCGSHCTDKYHINIIDKDSKAIGKTADGKSVGEYGVTNPKDGMDIQTTKGKNFKITGSIPKGTITDNWRKSYTLSYDTQKWNSGDCANWKFKSARPSNGERHQFDLWCEFDC
ncbi:hypothetical protein PG990_011670 [Apiospora arundinis]